MPNIMYIPSRVTMATAIYAALSCPVCYEHLDEPKILTCGHTICKKCLVDIYRSELSRQLPCPICRHVTTVPKGTISKLPTNITVKSLVQDLKSATQGDLEKRADIRIKRLIEHAEYVNQQKEIVQVAISACRDEVQKAHDEAVAKLAKRKSALLRECDNHESALLEKLDKLVQKDNELVSRISNARAMMGNTFQDIGTRYRDTLKDLLKTNDPNLSEASAITRRGEMIHFNKKQVDLDLGEVHDGDMKNKICVKLSKEMNCAAPTPDGKMAVGYYEGGIDIFSTDGELQQTVLQNTKIGKVAFLPDGRCVVRAKNFVISLYTPKWEKLDVMFDSLTEVGCLAVDCDDLIYVGYWKAKKIQVFTPSGGNAIMEIPCGGYEPRQISVIEPSKMLLVRTQNRDIRLLDQQGQEVYSVAKDSDTCAFSAAVCNNGTILIAAINKKQDKLSIRQYTSELNFVKTVIVDYAMKKKADFRCFLHEFTLGELALCTGNMLYIFHKAVLHLKESTVEVESITY